jgi:hypothetical protein
MNLFEGQRLVLGKVALGLAVIWSDCHELIVNPYAVERFLLLITSTLCSGIGNKKNAFLPIQPFRKTVSHFGQVLFISTFDFALPKDAHTPLDHMELSQFFSVSKNISLDLFPPKIGPCLWPLEQSTLMAVPETSVNQNRCFEFG